MAVNKEIIQVSVKGAGKTQRALKGIGSTALKMGAAFFAAKGLVTGINRIVTDSAKLQGVERAFDAMGSKIGFTENSFKKLQQATDGTVSKLDLMTQANNAMMLGVVKSDEEMAKLFDTAQRLGQAIGVDTTSALESLTTGMGRQSKLMLDNLGIMVNTEDAYEKYAKSIGKSKDQLSDQERKIAFNNEVLAVAGKMVDDLGEEQLTTADKMARLGSTFEDMGTKIGAASEGFISKALDGFQSLADGVADTIDFSSNIDWNATMANLGSNFNLIWEAFGKTVRLAMDILPDAMGDVIPKTINLLFEGLKKIINAIVFVAADLWTPIGNAFETLIFDIGAGWQRFRLSTAQIFELFASNTKNIFIGIGREIIGVINDAASASNKILGTSFEMIEVPDLIDTEGMVEKQKDAMDKLVQGQADARQAIIDMQDSSEIIDMLSSMFSGTDDEDDLDTFQQFSDALVDVWTTAGDQIIEVNENVEKSNKKRFDGAKDSSNESGTAVIKMTDEQKKAGMDGANQMVADLKVMSDANAKYKKIYKATAIATTIASTYESAQEQFKKFSQAFPAPFGQILGVAAAAAAVGSGMARVDSIRKAQYGADFITSGPEMMMVGEGSGPERVQVTPLVDPNIDGPQGESGITLNISGNVLHESFIEDQVIPQIREGLRLGENMGV